MVFEPKTPMRRANDDALVRLRVDPATWHETASKNQLMHSSSFNHGKLKITIKRRGRNIFPYRPVMHRIALVMVVYMQKRSATTFVRLQPLALAAK